MENVYTYQYTNLKLDGKRLHVSIYLMNFKELK